MSVELENHKASKEEATAQPLAELPTLDLLAKPSPISREGSQNLLSPLSDRVDAKTLLVGDPYKLSLDLSAVRAHGGALAKNEPSSLKLSDPFVNCPRPRCPFDGPAPSSQSEMSKVPSLKEQLEQLQLKDKAKAESGATTPESKDKAATETKSGDPTTKPSAETKPAAELNPPSDAKPADKTQRAEIVEPRDGKGGRNAVQNYEQKQGARIAGSNVAPPIDSVPRTLPSNLIPGHDSRPSNPQQSDLRPKQTQPQDSFTPFQPGDNRPIVPANHRTDSAQLIPDANVKPAEYRPEVPDVKDQLKQRYETHDAAQAIKMAKELGLPLAVHIGASWCGPCRTMDATVWPKVEGTEKTKGTLQGKMVTLHIDVDEMSGLKGDAAKAAQSVASNPAGYPTIRVFSVDGSTGKLTQQIQKSGGLSVDGLTRLLQQGGVR